MCVIIITKEKEPINPRGTEGEMGGARGGKWKVKVINYILL